MTTGPQAAVCATAEGAVSAAAPRQVASNDARRGRSRERFVMVGHPFAKELQDQMNPRGNAVPRLRFPPRSYAAALFVLEAEWSGTAIVDPARVRLSINFSA